MVERPHKEVLHTAGLALASGGRQTSITTTEWDVSGTCDDPKHVPIWGRPPSRGRPTKGHANHVHLETRCRRCDACLRRRAWLWRERARAEFAHAPRTWFGTLTCRPDQHWEAEVRGIAEARAKAIPLAEMDPFSLRYRTIARWLTKYLKRLREDTGAAIRYIAVAERHKSGLPHLHLLLHEVELTGVVLHRQLTEQWPHGFTKWKLVASSDACGYVTKYLCKDIEARVRASIRYGQIEDLIRLRTNSIGRTSVNDTYAPQAAKNALNGGDACRDTLVVQDSFNEHSESETSSPHRGLCQ